MKRRFLELKDRPEMDKLLRESAERFKAMSHDEQEAMLRKQRESWARQDMD